MVSFAQPLFLYLNYSLYLCIVTLFLCISMFVSLSIFLLSISLSLLLSFYLQLSLIICISYIQDTMKNEVLEGRGESQEGGPGRDVPPLLQELQINVRQQTHLLQQGDRNKTAAILHQLQVMPIPDKVMFKFPLNFQ